MNSVFIKVGSSYINPATIRMVTVHKIDVDIFFNGVSGFRTVSLGDAELLLAYINTQHI